MARRRRWRSRPGRVAGLVTATAQRALQDPAPARQHPDHDRALLDQPPDHGPAQRRAAERDTVLTPFEGLGAAVLVGAAAACCWWWSGSAPALLVRFLASEVGLAMRATGVNPRMAEAQGIRVGASDLPRHGAEQRARGPGRRAVRAGQRLRRRDARHRDDRGRAGGGDRRRDAGAAADAWRRRSWAACWARWSTGSRWRWRSRPTCSGCRPPTSTWSRPCWSAARWSCRRPAPGCWRGWAPAR